MITVNISIDGLDELIATYEGAAAMLPQVLDGAVDQAADELVRIIQTMPPVNSKDDGYDALGIPVAPLYGGTLRQSVHKEIVAPMERVVTPDTDYADFVVLGTSKMQGRDFLTWALENFGGYDAIERIVQGTLDNLFGSGSFVSAAGSF